ncbi:membrane protein [Paucilactobacillus hokkaidonensis JCM 18461]|uniref:Membrane protein n=2 Tax=Paucilactobacillus hokkaidonensis TaxID=1193095 RepID=A0A0A1GUL4_9LACO|nr:DMT family transporter [Paucilactobacillus hokkaidonensis]KRO07966.1 transport protein [Paucilactobacillus hokkaidonensis]BAP84704.1 membrane protein [Paucilactobacillus hokkaidonensis JCM 18461]
MQSNSHPQNITKGLLWATLASELWGISGTVLQYISQNLAIPATWFLSVRTLSAGIVLLIIGAIIEGKRIFAIFIDWKLVGWLIAYSLFGLMANLYTFYMSVQKGNAAAATILQYLSPLFIVLGGLVILRRPMRSDLIAFAISLVGLFLAITKGNIHELSIPMDALIWGILSGVTAACYVVLPRKIVEEHSPIVVLGWGMLISGVLFNIWHPVWVDAPQLNFKLVSSLAVVVIVGTILAFSVLLYSLNFAPSAVISIVDAVQPVVTFILSVIFLHVKLSWIEVLGSALIILAIYVLQHFREGNVEENI